MQEIALLLSSLAGVATAAAVRRAPKPSGQLLSLGASSQVRAQINSLRIEKDILTKTISRLYDEDAGVSTVHRDKLLSKYQHQLGTILSRLEKLEEASKHPDLGPVGDGLMTLMDQKLSRLDDRLYEISSRMARPAQKPQAQKEAPKKEFDFKPAKQGEPRVAKSGGSFELTTLTRVPGSPPKNPQAMPGRQAAKPAAQAMAQPVVQPAVQQSIEPTIEPAAQPVMQPTAQPTMQPTVKPAAKPAELPAAQQTIEQATKPKPDTKAKGTAEIAKPAPVTVAPDLTGQLAQATARKALPEPKAARVDDYDDDDDGDDLDQIKGNIMKVLSKLDQAEVE